MKKYLKIGLILLAVGIFGGGGFALYMFNMPHRDVQSTESDFEITAANLVREYLEDPFSANTKYLDAEGESKILEVSGEVFEVSEDFNNQTVVLLKTSDAKAGVSCTFLTTAGPIKDKLQKGQQIKVKGVIRSGAGYDSDLDMYEHVILEKCDLISKI